MSRSFAAVEAARPVPPEFGEPAPLFIAATDGVPNYNIGVAGGRWMVLLAFGTLASPASRAAHDLCLSRKDLFDDTNAVLFGVSADRRDQVEHGLANHARGVRYFWDFDFKIFHLYGLVADGSLRPAVFLIDRALRIVMAEPIEAVGEVLDTLKARLAEEARSEASAPFAPVLVLPRVFEPELCQRLVDLHRRKGGWDSGFAADVGGRTCEVVNHALKRRYDVLIEDEALLAETRAKLERRLFPMVRRAFNWTPTEIERFLVCRYSDEEEGFFSAHRDDVTAGTAHRKFAVSLSLNEGFEGGDVRFPEFGRRLYRAPLGGALVFCCSLLHEVVPVTAGERYVFVPFLFDEAGARLRRNNLHLVADSRREPRAKRRRPR
jgi:peroxiredoxin/predicted 2-oxoglutarate/Fe(II)-dependent dioxygenase YbiX